MGDPDRCWTVDPGSAGGEREADGRSRCLEGSVCAEVFRGIDNRCSLAESQQRIAGASLSVRHFILILRCRCRIRSVGCLYWKQNWEEH
jgi:hypothetical protein